MSDKNKTKMQAKATKPTCAKLDAIDKNRVAEILRLMHDYAAEEVAAEIASNMENGHGAAMDECDKLLARSVMLDAMSEQCKIKAKIIRALNECGIDRNGII